MATDPADRCHHSRLPSFRGGWLALATVGPAVDLVREVAQAGGAPVRVVADAVTFARLLVEGRPRIAVVEAPPAGPAELRLVASERRRRTSLRIVHLAPPEAIEDRLAALGLGFDESLSTAISTAELAGRLAMLTRREREGGRAGGTWLAVADDVVLDLSAHDLRRDGARVHLRPKEFGLLELLASHPGRVYTRGQLLDRVWGPDHTSGPRTVDVHVRWLRSKIELDPERPVHLVTVHGIGYRFDPPSR